MFGQDKNKKFSPAQLTDNGIFLEKIVISGAKKNEIKKELEITGLSESVVFPDMSNTARDIKEKFK